MECDITNHLFVDVRTAAKELRITDGIRQVGVEEILAKSGWGLICHLDAVL